MKLASVEQEQQSSCSGTSAVKELIRFLVREEDEDVNTPFTSHMTK